MISLTKLQLFVQDLSQNSTAEQATRTAYLANNKHRYLMQKFFGNEGSYQIQTIGATELTLASGVPIGSTSVTLASAWAYQTTPALLTFNDGETVQAQFTNGSTAVTWLPATTGLLYLLTGTLAAGATSATLQSAWTFTSGNYLTSFSDGSTKTVTYTKNSTAISWTGGLAGAQSDQIYTSTILTGSTATIGGVQFYPLPPNYSKLKGITITVGSLSWPLTEIRTIDEWRELNVFPYYASIPSKFFIYPGGDKNGQIGIYPIPSTTGNVITPYYKFRVPDLSMADYGSIPYSALSGSLTLGDTITVGAATGIIDSYTGSNISLSNVSGTFAAGTFTTGNGATGTAGTPGTVSATNGSTAVTGTNTSFITTTNQQLEARWIKFSQPQGDGLWYQIESVNSATGITLYQPYQGTSIVNTTGFTIGQMWLIAEDFHDMLQESVLLDYFSTIQENPKKADAADKKYKEKELLLAEYSGTNTVNVNLSRTPTMRNPNLFGQAFGATP